MRLARGFFIGRHCPIGIRQRTVKSLWFLEDMTPRQLIDESADPAWTDAPVKSFVYLV